MSEDLNWHKSTRSTGASNCVEVAEVQDGMLVRDSKDPDGPRLRFTPEEWRAFIAGAKSGEFDHQ